MTRRTGAPALASGLCLLAIAYAVTGCNSVPATDFGYGAAAAGGVAILAAAPGQQIEQVYYLGSFDPREQLPPTIYRITVRGQASGISMMKFGSGWVPASLIDSLNTDVEFADASSTRPTIVTGNGDQQSNLESGRRLIMFGPEGFREAPKDHRLVIVMGSSPDAFFNAIDQVLGAAGMSKSASSSKLPADLMNASTQAEDEHEQLTDLRSALQAEAAANGTKN